MPNLNWLFIFVPISVALKEVPGISPVLLFFTAAIAIAPIAHLLVKATEQLSRHTGDAVGGLLNATFGNAPELIISFVALRAGYLDMVRASLIGAILANVLLAQGLSFFLGGLRYHVQNYNPNATRTYSSMMMLAVVSLAIPSAVGRGAAASREIAGIQMELNVIVALLLLVTYGLYLVFMLKTHPSEFVADHSSNEIEEGEEHWSARRALLFLVGASILAAFVSEILVGAAEGTGHALGISQVFIGVICLSVVGGAAEIASAVAMARKDRMDLSIGIALGSSIQIALFVAPMLVLGSYFVAPMPLMLTFNIQGLVFMLLSVLIAGMISSDGHSNWYKGIQLLLVYLMLAVMLYLMPTAGI